MSPIAGSSQRGVVEGRREEGDTREEHRRRVVEGDMKAGHIPAVGRMAVDRIAVEEGMKVAGRRERRRSPVEVVVEDGHRSRSREMLVERG